MRVVTDPMPALAQVLLLVVLLGAGWVALTREGMRRAAGVLVVAVALAASFTNLVVAERYRGLSLAVRIVVLVLALSLAKYALGHTVAALKQSDTPGTPVSPARHGVLFMNLKSGGGKAERFHLIDECKRRGIEPVVLEPGQDWPQLVRDMAARGTDVVGMAGGDGSQAMVGSVAAELGLPMVVVPAGTRNH